MAQNPLFGLVKSIFSGLYRWMISKMVHLGIVLTPPEGPSRSVSLADFVTPIGTSKQVWEGGLGDLFRVNTNSVQVTVSIKGKYYFALQSKNLFSPESFFPLFHYLPPPCTTVATLLDALTSLRMRSGGDFGNKRVNRVKSLTGQKRACFPACIIGLFEVTDFQDLLIFF